VCSVAISLLVGSRAKLGIVGLGLVAVVIAVVIAGGGSSQPKNAAPSAGAVTSAFKGSPPQLASLHAQANQLLGGGVPSFDARLSGLRGHYPVVVNKWASWCVPCQSEFPVFQRAAVAFGKQVAFIGVNGKDHDAAAAAFLKKFPVTYPSYTDPNESIARSIQAATYYPLTVFYNRRGGSVFTHAGPYLSAAALEKDIRRYALG
jgi:cytochrome c biogenesis protein CcmG, thiol:disulfide interchange protein DsbE